MTEPKGLAEVQRYKGKQGGGEGGEGAECRGVRSGAWEDSGR